MKTTSLTGVTIAINIIVVALLCWFLLGPVQQSYQSSSELSAAYDFDYSSFKDRVHSISDTTVLQKMTVRMFHNAFIAHQQAAHRFTTVRYVIFASLALLLSTLLLLILKTRAEQGAAANP